MTEELKKQLDTSTGRRLLNGFLEENFKNTAQLTDKFDELTELYYQAMSVTNISALKTVDDIYIKHYLDSIYPYKLFSGSVCDVGCGGGFPSIPLAITTGLNITGVESVGKKLLLLHKCVTELQLDNLKSEYARSEDLVKLKRSYDTVCARAVADTDKALSYCAPLAKPDGKVLLYKTQNDVPAKKYTSDKYKVTLSDTLDYTLPGTDIKRRMFVYTRTGA